MWHKSNINQTSSWRMLKKKVKSEGLNKKVDQKDGGEKPGACGGCHQQTALGVLMCPRATGMEFSQLNHHQKNRNIDIYHGLIFSYKKMLMSTDLGWFFLDVVVQTDFPSTKQNPTQRRNVKNALRPGCGFPRSRGSRTGARLLHILKGLQKFVRLLCKALCLKINGLTCLSCFDIYDEI